MRRSLRCLVVFHTFLITAATLSAQISGTVITTEGIALPGVSVSAHLPEPSHARAQRLMAEKPERAAFATAVTDSHGRFALDTKKEPLAIVSFEKTGYAPLALRAVANEELGGIALRVSPAKKGRVTAGGKGVANAVVRIGSLTGAERIVRTGEDGSYEVPDPAEWANQITVHHPDYALKHVTTIGNQKLPLDIRIDTGVALAGKVVAEDGTTPVEGATLYLDGVPVARSGREGEFTLAHAPKNWRELKAIAGTRVAARTNPAKDLTLKLAKGASLTGRVLDAKTQKPLAGASVSYSTTPDTPLSASVAESVVTDSAGKFSIDALLPATLALGVTYPGFAFDSQEIVVRDRTAVSRAIAGTPLARISGSVADESRRAIGGVRISLSNDFRPRQRMISRETAYSTPDGRFVLRGVTPEESLQLIAQKKGFATGKNGPHKLAPAESKANVVITLPSGIALTGRVTDKEGRPLAGISVDTVENTAGLRMVMFGGPLERPDLPTTNASGEFEVRLKEGTYDLSFSGEGFATTRKRDVKVFAGAEPLTVTLSPAAELSGRVTHADGTGVGDVNVSSFAEGVQSSTITAPDGSFTLPNLSSGPVMVNFRKEEDFIFEVRSLTAPARDVAIQLENGSAVTGRVVDASTKKPITSFNLGFTGERGNSQFRMVTPPMMRSFTSDDGSFVLERIRSGSVQILAKAPGYVSTTVTVEVPENKPLRDVEVALTPGIRVTGKVTDADGSALAGARVAVETSSDGMFGRFTPGSATAVTDASGEYTLDGVAAGERTLEFSKEGYLPERKMTKLSGTDARLDARLSRGRPLRGVVVTESGAPVPDAEVRTFAVGQPPYNTRTDANGNFAIEGLAPGKYRLIASKTGLAPGEATDVDPESGAVARIVLKAGGVITGRVVGLTPEEMNQAIVTASGTSMVSNAWAAVDSQGRFRIEGVPTGTVRVSARAGTMMSGRQSTRQNVDVPSGGEVDVTIEFKSGTVVRGRVTRNDRPVEGATVSFMSADGRASVMSSTQTGAGGTYEISGLEPGKYNVGVMDMSTFNSFTTTYEVRGSETFDIDIRGARLTARVSDSETGQPVADALVVLSPIEREGMLFGVHEKRTTAAGEVTIESLQPGRYVARASKDGYAIGTADVTIADSDRDIQLKLIRSEGVVLRIIDARDSKAVPANVAVNDMAGRPIYNNNVNPRPDGTVKVPLPPGTYRITVRSFGYAPREVTVNAPNSAAVTVGLTPGGTLVIDASDAKMIRLIKSNGEPYWLGGAAKVTVPAGKNTYPYIAPGSYTLQLLDANGTVSASHPVTISEGQTSNVRI